MANDFKSEGEINIGTSMVDVFTAPALKTCMMIQLVGCNLANSAITVNVQIFKAVGSKTINYCKGDPIPPGATIRLLDDDKLVLEPGDKIRVQSSVAASLDVFYSYIEDINS